MCVWGGVGVCLCVSVCVCGGGGGCSSVAVEPCILHTGVRATPSKLYRFMS